MLTTISHGGSHSYENEREILYKILYELRGNVSDLKRDMNSLRKQLDEARERQLFTSQAVPAVIKTETPRPVTTVQDAEAEEISDMETLNLDDIGRQMIEKALDRNNGNRKKAAQELGISDRTLYRRIKQFGLDKKNHE